MSARSEPPTLKPQRRMLVVPMMWPGMFADIPKAMTRAEGKCILQAAACRRPEWWTLAAFLSGPIVLIACLIVGFMAIGSRTGWVFGVARFGAILTMMLAQRVLIHRMYLGAVREVLRARGTNLCDWCGYPLAQIPDALVCPECGTWISAMTPLGIPAVRGSEVPL